MYWFEFTEYILALDMDLFNLIDSFICVYNANTNACTYSFEYCPVLLGRVVNFHWWHAEFLKILLTRLARALSRKSKSKALIHTERRENWQISHK